MGKQKFEGRSGQKNFFSKMLLHTKTFQFMKKRNGYNYTKDDKTIPLLQDCCGNFDLVDLFS